MGVSLGLVEIRIFSVGFYLKTGWKRFWNGSVKGNRASLGIAKEWGAVPLDYA
jgi:hypothetical protein